MRKIALRLAVSLLMSSCATILHGTNETINIRSEEPNTLFFVNQKEIGQGTFVTVTIPKKQLSESTLRATKVGCKEKTMPIAIKIDPVGSPDDVWTGAIIQAAQTDYLLTPECTKDMPKNTLPSKFRKSLDLLREEP